MNNVSYFLKKSVLIYLFSIIFLPLSAQRNNIIPPPPFIKTVVLKPLDPEVYAPIVKLGEKLILSFDDINAGENIYSYRIEHCDYNWQLSNLSSTEYMTGFATDRIRNYQNSYKDCQHETSFLIS